MVASIFIAVPQLVSLHENVPVDVAVRAEKIVTTTAAGTAGGLALQYIRSV